jgi:hypothetical protein
MARQGDDRDRRRDVVFVPWKPASAFPRPRCCSCATPERQQTAHAYRGARSAPRRRDHAMNKASVAQTTQTIERRPRVRRVCKRASVSVAVAGLALWTTACSSAPATPSVATLTAAASTAASSGPAGAAATPDLMKFAACMRAHGVPDFPDPVDGGFHINNTTPGSDLDGSSPQFVAANTACKAFSPEEQAGGGTVDPKAQAQALAYAACIRSHGVPSYPDPVFVGGSIREAVRAGSGPDPDSPLFIAAQKACQSLEPFARGSSGP